ncbi:MAG: hydroxymethylglutaryl-CoA lyase [Deltaproteobacteria bacterium]|jgi:hydroxymethylglutaryl-CoA lyase|nr:hydroxymethylglutaryl-CoA lyase [Deltaproteobacteria bacterium]
MSEGDPRAPDVGIYEVSPRDGLQNEDEFVSTEAKLELIALLTASGLRRVEVASFVSPSWIPQLADADELVSVLRRSPGVRYGALVPNEKGYERLRAAGPIDVVGTFVSASETHNQKNVNCSIAEQLARLAPVFERSRADGIAVRAYVSTVCGCPYEGEVAVRAVVDLSRELIERGAAEVSLGDTIGVGHPNQVRELVGAVASEVSIERIALHLHDTYGRALANAQAGFEGGVRIFDTSLAGLGGCPYAPGASGNVATEDLVDLFEREGIRTGVDLDALVDASAWLERDVLGRRLPGRVFRARLGERERERRAL